MRNTTLVLGAVAYDPKVVTIWDGFKAYFERRDLAFDYVLYTSYESQVAAQFARHIHVAWNSPLAWLQCERIATLAGRRAMAIAMRDTDRDLSSVVVVRADSDLRALDGLKGCRVAVGASDSPQATLIPLSTLADQGLNEGKEIEVRRFDLLTGKHGDHVGGEREAIRALVRGEVEAACILDANHLAFSQDGTIAPGTTRILERTPLYDHCNFTALDGGPEPLVERFQELLLEMSYADAAVRPLLDMEGLKRWLPGRTSGYAELERATRRFGSIDAFVASLAP